MHGFRLIVAMVLLCSMPARAVAQPLPLQWTSLGADAAHPVARATHFDLAFGPDQKPVLASVASHGVEVRRWTGAAWVSLAMLGFENAFPMDLHSASNWAGDIVVGVRVSEPAGSVIRVYHLVGSNLVQLGPSQPLSEAGPFALTYDARGPVLAWAAGGFVTVKRWNGAGWSRLGTTVNDAIVTFRDPSSPAMSVTGNGRLAVAYARMSGDVTRVEVREWTGSGWVALGDGPISPSRSPSLAGMDSGSTVAASLGAASQVGLWNGSAWIAAPAPCPVSPVGATLAPPAINAGGNQLSVVCALGAPAQQPRLVARRFALLGGWTPIGGASINGSIPLAAPLFLLYVARSAPNGQLWVAWTCTSPGGVGVIVSTTAPGGLAPGS